VRPIATVLLGFLLVLAPPCGAQGDSRPATRPGEVPGIGGRVADRAGQGIPGARVALYRFGDWGASQMTGAQTPPRLFTPAAETRTDASGTFLLSGLEPGVYHVAAEKELRSWAVAANVTAKPLEFVRVEIILGAERLLVGEVRDPGGNPVAGASVVVTFQMQGSIPIGLKSDASGTFRIPTPEQSSAVIARPSDESVTIWAVKSGVGIGSEKFQRDELPPILTVPLFRTRTLTCRFVSDDGGAVPEGIRFSIDAAIPPRELHLLERTGPSGIGIVTRFPEVDAFSILVDDPSWCLPPSHKSIGDPGGFASVTTGRPMRVAPTGDVTVEVLLTRTGSVGGTVVDKTSGRPVPGLRITGAAPWSDAHPRGDYYRVETVADAEGRFRLDGLQRSEVKIDVFAHHLGPPRWEDGRGYVVPRQVRWLDAERGGSAWNAMGAFPHSLREARMLEGVVIQVVESATVEGTVVDASGQPVEGAGVSMGDRSFGPPAFATDSKGRFKLTGVFPALKQRLLVRPTSLPEAWSEPLDLAPGARVTGVKIAIAGGRRLIVRVVGQDGAPVRGARVEVVEGNRNRIENRSFHDLPHAIHGTTGDDGRATFQSLTDAQATVWAYAPGLQAADDFEPVVAVGPADSTEVTVTLRPQLVIPGTLVLEDGSPLAKTNVTVDAVVKGDPFRTGAGNGFTAPDGAFTIQVRSEGPYVVREIVRAYYAPTGVGANTELRYATYSPVTRQELRAGQPATIVVRRR
jgi:protocatechuate 3,4-dioxygenase beta subunit